jgi:hypothetical protein
MIAVAVALESVPMSLKDKYTFCCAPVQEQNEFAMGYLITVSLKISGFDGWMLVRPKLCRRKTSQNHDFQREVDEQRQCHED